MNRKIIFLPLIACGLLAFGQERATYLRDNSDWWSIVRVDSFGIDAKPGSTDLDERNFRIAGISLRPEMFEEVAKQLGQVSEVTRGDASTGRHQVCYKSTASSPTAYLIFEFGEVEETFYLLQGGPDWHGSEYCTSTAINPAEWKTATGLRIGLARGEVERILGRPDTATGDRIVYLRETRRKTTTKEFAEIRKDYPRVLSDAEAHKMFDYYDVQSFVDARFAGSRLIYLAVSHTETN